jgi:hypothetical protein
LWQRHHGTVKQQSCSKSAARQQQSSFWSVSSILEHKHSCAGCEVRMNQPFSSCCLLPRVMAPSQQHAVADNTPCFCARRSAKWRSLVAGMCAGPALLCTGCVQQCSAYYCVVLHVTALCYGAIGKPNHRACARHAAYSLFALVVAAVAAASCLSAGSSNPASVHAAAVAYFSKLSSLHDSLQQRKTA